MTQYPENKLELSKIARSQGKSARSESGLTEGETVVQSVTFIIFYHRRHCHDEPGL